MSLVRRQRRGAEEPLVDLGALDHATTAVTGSCQTSVTPASTSSSSTGDDQHRGDVADQPARAPGAACGAGATASIIAAAPTRAAERARPGVGDRPAHRDRHPSARVGSPAGRTRSRAGGQAAEHDAPRDHGTDADPAAGDQQDKAPGTGRAARARGCARSRDRQPPAAARPPSSRQARRGRTPAPTDATSTGAAPGRAGAAANGFDSHRRERDQAQDAAAPPAPRPGRRR